MAEYIKDGKFTRFNTPVPAERGVMSLFNLSGKTAVMSGAGQGIGLAVAKALAEVGCNVAIWYNSNEEAVAAAESVAKAYCVKCKAYKVDVTSYEAVEQGLAEAIKDFNGRLDVFIANAGVSWGDEAFIDASISRYHNLMKINTDGAMYCAHVAGKHFRRQKQEGTTIDGKTLDNFSSGSLIMTASMSGKIVNIPRRQAVYNASKAALIHMCKSLSIEWLGFSRVNSVSPGYINTGISGAVAEEVMDAIKDKVPMGRFGETVELKGIYLYLASDASSYTTGADFSVDGGYTAH